MSDIAFDENISRKALLIQFSCHLELALTFHCEKAAAARYYTQGVKNTFLLSVRVFTDQRLVGLLRKMPKNCFPVEC